MMASEEMNKTNSETDWSRVLAFKEGAPIPYEPEDGPYDPNNDDATRAWVAEANVIRHGKVVRRSFLETSLPDARHTEDIDLLRKN
jgi:hypothetical protein